MIFTTDSSQKLEKLQQPKKKKVSIFWLFAEKSEGKEKHNTIQLVALLSRK